MEKPWIKEAQRRIDLSNEMLKNPLDCYSSINGDRATSWTAEIILEFKCGMDEELVELLFSNIHNHKPHSIKSFKKKIQDRLDEAAFWSEENAKFDLENSDIEEPIEDEYSQWLKDESNKEKGYQF